jgi:hypothetical protein
MPEKTTENKHDSEEKRAPKPKAKDMTPENSAQETADASTIAPEKKYEHVGCLTSEEKEAFREDYREKDREVQRNIGIYLSGLILITGWLIGPQTKPLIKMALDNDGYNLFGFIIVAALNAIFLCFLIYKSLLIHEIMQFVVVHSERESGFNYWEAWRRSPQSATNGSVRIIYNGLVLLLLPLFVSIGILVPLGYLIHAGDTQKLSELLKQHEVSASSTASPQPSPAAPPVPAQNTSEVQPATETPLAQPSPVASSLAASPDQLNSVFRLVWWFFWGVVILHLLPIWFFFHNVYFVSRRWKVINKKQIPPDIYQNLGQINVCVPIRKVTDVAQETNSTSKLGNTEMGHATNH